MPHILIKVAPGKTDDQKRRLTEAITKDTIEIFNTRDEAVTVALEEVEKADWTEKVYIPDIQNKWDTLTKKPGYNPFA